MALNSTHTPRIVGYFVLLSGLLLLGFLAAFLLREAVHTGRTLRVHFPEIATLSEGDPVVERGVTIGKVRRITLEGSVAVTELQLYHHDFIAADARFVNLSHSLMGARKVALVPGNSPLPLDETQLQEGVFLPGPAEVLHKVNVMAARVVELRILVDKFFADDGSLRAPLAAQEQLDKALRDLEGMADKLEAAATALGAGAVTAAKAGDRTAAGLHQLEPDLDQARRRLAGLLASLDSAEAGLSTALTRVEMLATALEDTTGSSSAVGLTNSRSLHGLLTDRAAYDGLVRSVEALTALSQLLRDEGLGDSLKIKPRLRKK